MYAIVDIETTGGYAARNGIIEIAVKVFDGKEIVEQYETLINPGQQIPKYIQAFTGIDNEMVQHAPRFEDVAREIYYLLNDKIFIAHNVNFDYSFIKNSLQEYGYTLNAKKLCTIRLSRQVFPGLRSYGLGSLCRSLDIEIVNRHRAGGDAAATAVLFKKILQQDINIVERSLKKLLRNKRFHLMFQKNILLIYLTGRVCIIFMTIKEKLFM